MPGDIDEPDFARVLVLVPETDVAAALSNRLIAETLEDLDDLPPGKRRPAQLLHELRGSTTGVTVRTVEVRA